MKAILTLVLFMLTFTATSLAHSVIDCCPADTTYYENEKHEIVRVITKETQVSERWFTIDSAKILTFARDSTYNYHPSDTLVEYRKEVTKKQMAMLPEELHGELTQAQMKELIEKGEIIYGMFWVVKRFTWSPEINSHIYQYKDGFLLGGRYVTYEKTLSALIFVSLFTFLLFLFLLVGVTELSKAINESFYIFLFLAFFVGLVPIINLYMMSIKEFLLFLTTAIGFASTIFALLAWALWRKS